jgi:oligosaccharyltransferase complex subunit epsilon
LIDAYLVYIVVTGVMQFAYCCLVGTFPFNAFLAGFISCIGSFVLAACLRLQVRLQDSLFFGFTFCQSPSSFFNDSMS